MSSRILSSTLRGTRQNRLNSRPVWKGQWVCQLCRSHGAARRAFSLSSSFSKQKPYYITTPIFYVNAAPHVGHLYTMVLTDILKRWQVLKGREAILCTGTDEHGMKIQQAAASFNMPPKEFCDRVADTFKKLAQEFNLSNDHFIRTTDEEHRNTVQLVWRVLDSNGYIYQSKHEGWYCVSDETYYPDSAIEKRLDPYTGKTFMASKETGKEVEWTSETNYHFRLSAFKDKLLQYYRDNPEFVVPSTRMKDVVKWVEDGLEDLSISRPVERLSWGIRVPDDDSQTIYVWLDALINYITKAGYPWTSGTETLEGWPADVQVIGKDIVRFHCIYWPAFLMALDVAPPKQILAHAHWTLGSRKMAKSTGNVVNPILAMQRFGVDVMRYYLAHDGGIVNDSDYGNDLIVERYKKGLQGGLGNLASRIMRPKIWSVPSVLAEARDGNVYNIGKTSKAQVDMLNTLRDRVNVKFDQLDPGGALQVIMDAVYETNKYLQSNSPWKLAKELAEPEGSPLGTTEDDKPLRDSTQARINRTIYHCAETLRIVGILLQPYMPDKARELLDTLGVAPDRRAYDDACLGLDFTYGVPLTLPGKGSWGALFPPLPVED